MAEANKTFNKEQEKEVIRLYQKGLSCNQIAIKFNCSKFPVLRALKGISKRTPGFYSNHRNKNQFGKNNASWKGGIKDVYNRFRDLSKYYDWRKQVLNRDGDCCTSCKTTEKLQVHHIKTLKTLIIEFSSIHKLELKELTREHLTNDFFYDINNGLTLCEPCHRKWHKEHGR